MACSATAAPRRGTTVTPRWSLGSILVLAALAACSPRAREAVGAISPRHVPASELPRVHRKIVFQWDYSQPELRIRGDGVARISAPDSARFDFFVNGQGTGHALLVGDQIRLQDGQQSMRDFLPPAPLLWAALGRLHVPAASDTTVRVDSDTLRVDIGHEPGWRATLFGGELRRLELIDGGRIPQWVSRPAGGPIRYEQPRLRRTLLLTVSRVDTVPGFDASIWR
ncbi:MAG: hypothetical protein H0U66_01415 [Gemmatimonadaceae bacterium]|nr:hypothetical protein [Gemmatimonadaceae bacterium]